MKRVLLLYGLITGFCIGCNTRRNLVYFSDLKDSAYKSLILNQHDPEIQANDILGISISSLNPESNVLFNKGMLLPSNQSGGESSISGSLSDGYTVDKNGMIHFPVIGMIKLAGLNREGAELKMTEVLSNYVKNPIVNVRFLNFKVTVIGEVNKPSSFTIQGDRINVLEALGLAGDMTPFGKRQNVLVIREKSGVRSMERMNLNNKDVFSSPFFYLQQNDIVYVEPENKEKSAQTNNDYRLLPILTATISAIAVLLTRIL